MKTKINIHFIFILLSAILWGVAGIFVRTLQAFEFTQMQTVFGRSFLSAVILGFIVLIKDKALFKIRLKDLWLFVSAGLFSIILFNYSYYMTMSLASLSVAAVLLYTAPFFVVIISLPLFNKKLTVNKCIACIMAFIGCCFVSGLFSSAQRISGKALFFGLLTGLGYALYTIFGELLLNRGYKTLTITFYVFLSSTICSVPFLNIPKTFTYVAKTPEILITLVLMAIFNTVIPYLLYTSGLKGVDPSIAPIIATVEPVVATLVGAIIYKEAISLLGAVGILLVLASVVILNIKRLIVTANAKINLTLGITGKRDDGYHLIDTIMQSISLSDTVKLKKSKDIKVSFSDKTILSENSIAHKAALVFFEAANIKSGADIKIINRIPTSSGMGGGSADAAAVLLGLNHLYKAAMSYEELEKIAIKLGADVPFFIRGGAMRAQGIGEILTPLNPLEKGYFVLAKADSKPSTAEMYKRLDNEKFDLPDTESAIKALENKDVKKLTELMENSFVSVWGESKLKQILASFSADGVSLSGSGPTWFTYFTNRKKALRAYRSLKAQNIECYFARPKNSAIEIE